MRCHGLQSAVWISSVALLLTGCGPTNGGFGTAVRPDPTFSYSCPKVMALRVRFDATSATVTVDGEGPYTLPQVSGRSDFTQYSDGSHVLQVYRGEVSYATGRAQLQTCSRG